MNRDDIIRMAREADFGDGIVEFIGGKRFFRLFKSFGRTTKRRI